MRCLSGRNAWYGGWPRLPRGQGFSLLQAEWSVESPPPPLVFGNWRLLRSWLRWYLRWLVRGLSNGGDPWVIRMVQNVGAGGHPVANTLMPLAPSKRAPRPESARDRSSTHPELPSDGSGTAPPGPPQAIKWTLRAAASGNRGTAAPSAPMAQGCITRGGRGVLKGGGGLAQGLSI